MSTLETIRADDAIAELRLSKDECLWIAPGRIVGMQPQWRVSKEWSDHHPNRRGALAAWIAKILLLVVVLIRIYSGGQSLLLHKLHAAETSGRLLLAGKRRGVIRRLSVEESTTWVNPDHFVAASDDAVFSMTYESLYRYTNGRGAPMIRCEKALDLFVEGYGDIVELTLNDDGDILVQDASLVAFCGELAWKKVAMPGGSPAPLARKGWGYRFTGKGTLWLQTRTPSRSLRWLNGMLVEA